ncbi:MAG TPA: amidohydrolase [Terriglobales bacterium]|nr:amidohydrolase [Terriglobales bacterium]
MRKAAFCLLLTTAAAFAQTEGRPAASLIITNAKVWTVDSNQPKAEAVAVLGDRIVAVGTASQVDAWRGAETRVVDAGGKLVLPGFNDAHVHFIAGGLQLDSVDLKDADSPQEFARRVAARARRAPKEWITGGDWDEQKWDPPQLPARALIDAETPDTPVFVSRYDGHEALANSVALRLAGITSATLDPAGGEIVRDPSGKPTGILKDAALAMVERVIPPLSRERRIRAALRALGHAASLGVTSVQDMNPDFADVAAYSELAEQGRLTSRIYAAPVIARWQEQARVGLRRAFGSPYLRMGAVKGYADGSLGSSTAYFFDPYIDQPNSRGLLSSDMQPESKMLAYMTGADAAGLQLCIHAIGDAAISKVLDMFTTVGARRSANDRRWRIEHAQHMAPGDFERFARLKVIASVQPYHAIDDGRWAEKRIGPERIKTTYAFKTFLDHGVRLALGTDWTVAPLNPMETIYAAVTRATLDGQNPNGWLPEQKLTVAEAVEAYTLGSAYAEFQDAEKGTITAGKLADMVVLSDDIFTIRKEAIRDVRVETTIVGGKVVFTRAPAR